MAEFPALPLFTDAYLADTGHLTDAEHGIYLKLLMLMWRNPNCRIPNDDQWIARHLGRSMQDFEKQVKPIMQEFMLNSGNWLTQGRLTREWEWCRDRKRKATDAAKSRWEKEKSLSERNASEHSSSNAPYPTLPIKKKKDIAQNGHANDFDIFWKAYPRHEAKKKAEKALVQALKETTIAVLLAAIERQRPKWTDPQFIPHPASWLNQGRWQDELPVTTQQNLPPR